MAADVHRAGKRCGACHFLHYKQVVNLIYTTDQANITRTKDQAIDILRGYQAEIGSSQDKFAELASKHSDCSSHTHGGDLGWFGKGQMQKPFEQATYALDVGQISDVISTDSGVHLILRTG